MDAQLNFLLKELSVGYSGLLSTLRAHRLSVRHPMLFFSNLNVLPIRDRASKKNEPATDKLITTGSLAKSEINTPEQEGGCKLKIVDNLTTVNFRSGNMTPKYIVIHYFGALGTAKGVSEYFRAPGIKRLPIMRLTRAIPSIAVSAIRTSHGTVVRTSTSTLSAATLTPSGLKHALPKSIARGLWLLILIGISNQKLWTTSYG